MDIRVLGLVEAAGPAGLVSLGGTKQRTVLAQLVAVGGRPISVDRLVDGVWGGTPSAGARSTLQTYVSNLRAAIGNRIAQRGDGYLLQARPDEVDASRFEAQAAVGRALQPHEPDRAATRLKAALAEWRGRPYGGVIQRELLHGEAVRLEEERLAALEGRIDADLACGRHAEVVPELEALTIEHPLRERFCAQHMVALYRSDRQADALRSFRRSRDALRSLGLLPSDTLQELEYRILRHDAALRGRR